MNAADDSALDDPRLLAIACEYLTELEKGHSPDRATYAARHPELTAAVADCLDGVEMVFAAGKAMRPKPVLSELPNESLGDFRIVREIGRGGMGIVYEAVQLSLGRKVALKVLPFAAGLDGRQRQRFQTEAHAAAQLHHTNIVPVYAVGCERGVHFFAMQMIEGRSLDSLIREYRGEPAEPVKSGTTIDLRPPATVAADSVPLGATTRLRRSGEIYAAAVRIAVQAADALEYAHQAGVIHRDIKPGNLLIDGRGHLWIADFGLAQIQSETGHTRTGDIFGTLRYMSPEQAAGRRLQIDHRSDVYSLGATLYELLTLQPMFAGDDRQDLLRRILHEEPAPLRKIDRHLPPELEIIVLKAVAKNADERYATAGELAADLRRYQDQRPILARRPTLMERARKWLRRHPEYAVAGVLLLVGGVVGLGTSTALIERERQRALDAYGRERQNALAADARFDLARRSVDDIIRIADEEFTGDPIDQAHRRRFLEAAVAYYREFGDLQANRPEMRSELEATRARLQVVLGELNVLRNAERHMMLTNPDVGRDLKLAPEQEAQLASILPGDADWDRVFSVPTLEMMRRHEAQIAAILTPAQYGRLIQIAFQMKGSRAIGDPDIGPRLALTADQRAKIRELDLRGGPPGRGRNPEAFLEVLTDEQRKTWRELVGEPFRGSFRDMRGGPKGKDGPGGPPKRPFGDRGGKGDGPGVDWSVGHSPSPRRFMKSLLFFGRGTYVPKILPTMNNSPLPKFDSTLGVLSCRPSDPGVPATFGNFPL